MGWTPLVCALLVPVAGGGEVEASRKSAACTMGPQEYSSLLKKVLTDLTHKQVRQKGAPVDLLRTARFVSKFVHLGFLPGKELDRQLWKDIADHKRYKAGDGPPVGRTLPSDGGCALRKGEYRAYYLIRARREFQERRARRGCPDSVALPESRTELAAFLKLVSCKPGRKPAAVATPKPAAVATPKPVAVATPKPKASPRAPR